MFVTEKTAHVPPVTSADQVPFGVQVCWSGFCAKLLVVVDPSAHSDPRQPILPRVRDPESGRASSGRIPAPAPRARQQLEARRVARRRRAIDGPVRCDSCVRAMSPFRREFLVVLAWWGLVGRRLDFCACCYSCGGERVWGVASGRGEARPGPTLPAVESAGGL